MRPLVFYLTLLLCAWNLQAQNALHFDGTDDAVNCGSASSLNITGTKFSVEAWIYADAWNTNVFEGTIAIKENNSTNGGFMFRAGAGGKLNFAIGDGASKTWTELTSSAIMNTSTWYHVAATYDGSKMRLYLDGVLVDSLSESLSIGGHGSTPLTIGYHPTYTGRNWNGKLDEIRIWDTTLTKSMINANMNSEFCASSTSHLIAYYKLDNGKAASNNSGVKTAVDYSGNGNDGALQNFALFGSTSNWVLGKSLTQDTVYVTDSFSNCGAYYDTELKEYIQKSKTVTRHMPSSTGCDSARTRVVTILDRSYYTIDVEVCDSFVSPLGKVYRKTGTYYDLLTNAVGCDSVITINLIVGVDTTFIAATECDFYVSDGGKTYSSSGVFHETYTSALGCDSVVQITATILESTSAILELTTCDSVMNILQTVWLQPGESRVDTLPNAAGCDSVVSQTVRSLTSYHNFDVSNCYSYVSPSGKTWTSSGSYLDTIANQVGCDSILNIDVEILESSSTTLDLESCFELNLPTNNQVVTSSGTYVDTLTNAVGCDSVVTMVVIINDVDVNVIKEDQKLTASSLTGQYQWLDCNDGMSEVSEATSREFQTEHRGIYAVEVTDKACVDTSECFSIIGLGIDRSAHSSGLQIVPNPNNGAFQLLMAHPVFNAQLNIIDAQGRVVFEGEVANSAHYTFEGDLSSGLYLAVITDGEKSYMARLVIR